MVLQRTKERYLGKLTSKNCLKCFFFIIKYVYLVEPTKDGRNISTSKGQKHSSSESIGIRLWTSLDIGIFSTSTISGIQSPPVILTDPLKGPSRASEAPRISRIQRGSYQGLCRNDRTSWWPEARRPGQTCALDSLDVLMPGFLDVLKVLKLWICTNVCWLTNVDYTKISWLTGKKLHGSSFSRRWVDRVSKLCCVLCSKTHGPRWQYIKYH